MRKTLTSLAVLGGLAAGGAVAAAPATAGRVDPVQRSLNSLVSVDKFPGASASVRQADGRVRHYAAGAGNLRTGKKMPADARVRIASNTKMFTATVVLQLVGEGKVELDEPVETYLPGLVRGAGGIDGRKITVRQLLQQTSGLPDYDDELFTDFLNALHTYYEPHDLLKVAFARAPESKPGEKFVYSNTNYILAGLIVQKVTGRPVGEQITKRIIEPLGLRHTYWPADGETTIRGAHPRGYFPAVGGNPPVDISESESSAGWAAGALVGTPSDINTFLAGLLGGKLLKPAELAEMKKTVDAPGFDTVGGSRYGLGLATFKLTCGGFAWTHGGIAPGYVTYVGIAPSGKAASIAVNSMVAEASAAEHLDKSLDTALCG
ncbi:serine hydrolase domain-containing protein [Paractinoplanes brasiliensis]|uniref:D-alanyl-D-alanine carboxypeptidase n=1 Tax=Paractinoplanes brasiliensis TaxID=52695 RepID=A0A4R6JB65_9ACTN|nr:serine hydrolase domain-containing protein [Actinoplanes brasiliensis]TDO32983.1 D-alanyl-D-alanine carboxypeptidase [Actinoplanes brasiliensis]GID28702.1 serine hydrolase [Actinoplanes brasiliensis]